MTEYGIMSIYIVCSIEKVAYCYPSLTIIHCLCVTKFTFFFEFLFFNTCCTFLGLLVDPKGITGFYHSVNRPVSCIFLWLVFLVLGLYNY